jgi:uncharacterized protein YecE (DUF72 family)
MHGPEDAYASGYGDAHLERLIGEILDLRGVTRAWVYFNNDVGGHAPRDAARFRQLAGAAAYTH